MFSEPNQPARPRSGGHPPNLLLSRRRREEIRRRQQIRRRRAAALVAAAVALIAVLAAAGSGGGNGHKTSAFTAGPGPSDAPSRSGAVRALPGMPPPLNRHDVYAADRPGALAAVVRGDPARVYVPNSQSNTVDVIDQKTFRIVSEFPTGALPQHVTPS